MMNWLFALTIVAQNSFSAGDWTRIQDCRVRGGNVLVIGEVATCIPRFPLVEIPLIPFQSLTGRLAASS